MDKNNQLQKALIALVELDNGYAGSEVAKHVLSTLAFYEIKDKLGFITGDNHGANDTLCQAIALQVDNFHPVEGRLRCLSHIINLAVQAFLFCKDKAAVDKAERQSTASNTDIEAELIAAATTAGWTSVLPLRKLKTFTNKLSRSHRLFNSFKKLTTGLIVY